MIVRVTSIVQTFPAVVQKTDCENKKEESAVSTCHIVTAPLVTAPLVTMQTFTAVAKRSVCENENQSAASVRVHVRGLNTACAAYTNIALGT